MKKILSMRQKNLDQSAAFGELQKAASQGVDLRKEFTPDRIEKLKVVNGPLSFYYAGSLVNEKMLEAAQKLADELKLTDRFQDIMNGEVMNPSEKRKVLHHQPRALGKNFYTDEQKRIDEFAAKVHKGEIRGATGKKITTVVQIGIGGSDLGPRAFYEALEGYVSAKGKLPLKAHFISNVDPDDANSVLDKIDFERTLFVVVSKSGTTQETLTNLEFVKQKALAKGLKPDALKKQFIAVTGKGSPMDNPKEYRASFYIDDNIGGRYSVTSAVGGAVLSLALGPKVFREMLDGAREIDEAAKEKDIKKNMPLLDALLGVVERNIYGFPMKAIIPYSKALGKFTKHLQQLDAESNGKSVNRYGEKVNYQTGPMPFGEAGTDSQHSYFQKLHQGTDKIPIEFIGLKKPQIEKDVKMDGATSQDKLLANLVAQMVAFAKGKESKNQNDYFSGNRPTSLLFAEQLTPKVLGALLSHFENKVAYQGLAWNLNSFDQPGVELGKVNAKKILSKGANPDPVLSRFIELLKA